MRLEHAVIVGKREYLTRIKTKGFWIATVGLPLFMGALMIGPTILIARSHSAQRVAIVDASGGGLGARLGQALAGEQTGRRNQGAVHFDVQVLAAAPDAQAQRAELDRQVLAKKIDAWVWVSREGLAKNQVEYHAESVSNWLTQTVLNQKVSQVVSEWRLREAGYDSQKVADLTKSLDLETVRVSKAGSRAEGGGGGLALAMGLFFMLYTTLLIYGAQVMQGVLEEKSSRIVEVIASVVTPTELMAGKLCGICLLALTQLAIWMATAVLLTAPGLMAALVTLPSGVQLPSLAPEVVLNFFILFLLGFFLFATFYATLGAAFNSLQEAQQFSSIAVLFIVAPVMLMMPVINDPDSKLAVVASLIPFFTPLVMMLRIAVKMPPLWQLALAYTLTLATIALMVRFAARIYRVGILMYGKKPTIQEIWRWTRYA
jgi:ABC-2 type transport system permease protein